MASQNKFYLLVGSYCKKEEQGIFLYEFDTEVGKGKQLEAVSGIENPSYVCLDPTHSYVYAVSETANNKDGKVFAYAFDKEKKRLNLINQALTLGDEPCNLMTDRTGKWLYVTNYGSGSVAVFSLGEDGAVSPEPIQFLLHEGSGPRRDRQEGPHPHSVMVSPDNAYVYVADLGLDKIFCYKIDPKTGKLSPGEQSFIKTTSGSGPRITRFTKDGEFQFVIHELGGQISINRCQKGKLTQLEEISNLPVNFKDDFTSAEILLSPDEKFLYATNRDKLNDIVTYKIGNKEERLIPIDRQPTGGKTPRSFVITPDGKYVLIAHQNGEEITIFERNTKKGSLSLTRNSLKVPRAVCIIAFPMD